MNDRSLKELLSKYRAGTCTEEELALLENWVSATTYPEYVISEKELREDFELVAKALPLANSFVKPKVSRLWQRVGAAAAAVAAITLGVWLYYTSSNPIVDRQSVILTHNDIAPGKNTATLILEDGTVFDLDTNKTSVVVADSVRTMTMLTASTPRGGTYQVVLPDGTRVWLNADSKISFPSKFSGNERKVMLHGEAYFVVVHNAKQPFRVESRGQVVEDIGTAFNIEAYPGENPIKTTLVEGSASVSSLRGGTTRQSHLLKPNQQAILDNDQINVTEVDSEDAIAWKKDILLFKNEDLGTALKKVGRWYNVEIVYQGKVETKAMFTGRISRTRNLSSVIEMLEATGLARFKIEGRRLMVMQ